MIQRLSHATIWVDDQDAAYDFYVNKLGFEVREDEKMGPFRWLTVSPKTQPEMEFALLQIAPGPMMDGSSADTLRALIEKGIFGCGVLESTDVQRDYDELSKKGVRFNGPPQERPYGIDSGFHDPSGNSFRLTQVTELSAV